MFSQDQVVPPPPHELPVTPVTPVTARQQTSTPSPKSSPTASGPYHRSERIVSLLVGLALPLLAGTMVWWPWGVPDIFDSGTALLVVAISSLALSLLGAFVFRSMWAVLVVPCAWVVGQIVGLVVATLVQGATFEYFWSTTAVLTGLAMWPLAVCGGVGAMVGKWWHGRQQRI